MYRVIYSDIYFRFLITYDSPKDLIFVCLDYVCILLKEN